MSVRFAALLAMGSQYVAFTIQFVASVVLARWFIDPDELGLFSIAFAFIGLIAVLQEFGINRYVTGEAVMDEERIRTAFTLSLAVSWLVAILCVALAWPVAAFYAMPGLLPLLLIIAASYFLVPLSIVPSALLQRRMDFTSNSIIEIGVVLTNAAIAIALAFKGYGALALAWGAFAQQAARVLLAQWRNGWMLPFPPRLAGSMPILRFGGLSTTLNVLGQTGARLPELLIGRLLDPAAVGLFARAAGLAAQLRLLVSGALATVFYPAFARLRDRGEDLGPHYLRVAASYSAITWPAMAGLAACAVPLVRILYGERWLGAAELLQWIAISQILFVALPLHVELPILLGRMRQLVGRSLLDNAASVLLLAIGAWISLEMAAASRVAYGAVWLCIYVPFLQRMVGFSIPALVASWLQSALVSGAAVLPIALSYMFWAPPVEASFLQIATASFVGVLCWLSLLRMIRHPAYLEIHEIAAGAFAKLGWQPLLPAPR